jgi:poly[(R)-3-hydroxyalkanoate] polymerase subunit PhaC
MNPLAQLARFPAAAIEFTNILLTQNDAEVGCTPKDVVWTHRKTTLYRYRNAQRGNGIPILLVFALINRPDIFDLRPGHSFVEFLLDEGFDVFLIDWGYPEEEDADMGLEQYVCDELHWGIRETLRESGHDELTLLGWCIGGTLCLMYAGTHPQSPVRNLALLTTPVDTRRSLYATWVGRDSFDVDYVADAYQAIPGQAIDWANKLMKPMTNYWTTYLRLWEGVLAGESRRAAYQPMARWVADNPPFPAAAYRDWITWMYKQNRLVRGSMRLRGERVDLRRVDQGVLVVTAGADHIAPPPGTRPLLGLISSDDVTCIDRPGGHIGLMAGSKAREEIWPEIADWCRERSKAKRRERTHGSDRVKAKS